MIYDSDKRNYRDAKNALEHITNRHIRTDINQDASKYVFGPRLQGRQSPDAIAGKQAAVIDLNKFTFNYGLGVPLPGGDYAFSFNFGVFNVSIPFADVRFYTGIDNSKSGKGQLTQLNTVIVDPDCRTVVSSNPGGVGINR